MVFMVLWSSARYLLAIQSKDNLHSLKVNEGTIY